MKNRKYNPRSDAVQLAREAQLRQHLQQEKLEAWQISIEDVVSEPTPAPKRHRRPLWCWAVLLVLLVCLGVVLQFVWKQGRLPFYRPKFQLVETPYSQSQAVDEEPEFREATWANLEQVFPQIHKNDWLRLVNQDHPLPQGYEPELVPFEGSDFLLQPVVCEPLSKLYQQVLAETGEEILLQSTFRNYDDQAATYELMPDIAQKPGCSEHETGLAIDLAVFEHAGLLFIETAGGQATHRLAPQHGFILRYLEGQETVTGVTYEPWHFRYVGLPHSLLISESGQTLEEYYANLKPGVFYRANDYLISRQEGEQIRVPVGWEAGTASPDGMGGYLLTLHKN